MKTNKQMKKDARAEYRRMFSKKEKICSTPGSQKNIYTCQADSSDKFFAKYSRAHKYEGYYEWTRKKRNL